MPRPLPAVADGDLPPDPVVIGGLGGSGTRVPARILEAFGFYLGEQRNPADDNQWWIRLFSEPDWIAGLGSPPDPAYRRRLTCFADAMAGRSSVRNLPTILLAEWNGIRQHPGLAWTGLSMLTSRGYDASRHAGWSWKAPSTTLQIRHLASQIPDLRYVHMIRHGLDIAVKPKNYPEAWLDRIGDEIDPDAPLAWRSLRTWLAVNEDVIGFLEAELPDQHLIVRFEELCHEPRKQVERLASFLDLELDEATLTEAAEIPKPPGSIGRHADADPALFDEADLERLAALGYEPDWDG